MEKGRHLPEVTACPDAGKVKVQDRKINVGICVFGDLVVITAVSCCSIAVGSFSVVGDKPSVRRRLSQIKLLTSAFTTRLLMI